MTKRSVMLQNKLHELESELSDVFRLQLDISASDPRNQMSFDDLKKRLRFLSRLLTAEAASQPPHNSDQLRPLRQRLATLNAAFSYWNESRTRAWQENTDDTSSICSDFTPAALVHDGVIRGFPSPEKLLNGVEKEEIQSQPRTSSVQLYGTGSESPFREWNESTTGALHNPDDTTSICSDCTQALLYEDDIVRESDSPVSDPENVSGNKSPEKLLDDTADKDDDVKKKKKEEAAVAATEEKVWRIMGKYCGVFGGGMIVGAIFMVKMLSSSSSDSFIYEALLLPPT